MGKYFTLLALIAATAAAASASAPDRSIRIIPDAGSYKGNTPIKIYYKGIPGDVTEALIGGLPCTDTVMKKGEINCLTPLLRLGKFKVLLHTKDNQYYQADRPFYVVKNIQHTHLQTVVGKELPIAELKNTPPPSAEVITGGGFISQAKGVFEPPKTHGVSTVFIKESENDLKYITITTRPDPKPKLEYDGPETIYLTTGEWRSFAVKSGVPPYYLELIDGVGKVISDELLYIAPLDLPNKDTGGTATLKINDSSEQSFEIKVHIKAPPKEPTFSRKLASGDQHTCAISGPTQSIGCWGSNSFGELGNNSLKKSPHLQSVKNISEGAASIVAGGHHNCAVIQDDVKCWGQNDFGELGDGSYLSSDVPVTVIGLEGPILDLAAGENHTCALTPNGLYCWGRNHMGQLAMSTKVENSPIPVYVKELPEKADHIYAAYQRSCASVVPSSFPPNEAHTVKCWGELHWGKTLETKIKGSPHPIALPKLEGPVQALALGWSHGCALTSGQVKCWGFPDLGGLGVPEQQPIPFKPPLGVDQPFENPELTSGVTTIASGQYHTCAIKQGSLYCWGYNFHGEIGDGGRELRQFPTFVANLVGTPHQVSAGTSHTCVLLENDQIYCWGRNLFGQLGDGTYDMRITPVQVIR